MEEQSNQNASKRHLVFYILIAVTLVVIAILAAILFKSPASESGKEAEDQITDTEKSINMRERISDPITDNKYGFAFNTASHFHLSWEAKNLSTKTIKYCSYKVLVYNRVGDIIYSKTYTLTGPFEPGDILGVVNDVIVSGDFTPSSGDLDDFHKIEISEITLEYMDGSKEHGRYGFSTENTYKIGGY